MSTTAPVVSAATTVAAFPWLAVLTTIFGSGVVAAVVQSGISAIGANRDRHRHGRDTALRAAAVLEEFARDITETARQSKTYDRYDEDREFLRSIPTPPDVTDLDWTVVPEVLVARAFGFEQVATIARAHVADAFGVDDDLALQLHFRQAVRLGLLAWAIACDLRTEFGLPSADVRINQWDFSEWLHETQTEIDAEVAEITALFETKSETT